MEVYVLDAMMRRTDVIDRFESLIWTDRYNSLGDFKLEVTSSESIKTLLAADTMLACSDSLRVMIVETHEDKVTEEGKKLLVVAGRSVELVLMNRAVLAQTITDTPGDICRTLFNNSCVLGTLSSSDILPYLGSGSIFPVDTNTEYPDDVTLDLPAKSLYDAIRDICVVYDLGFRLCRHPVTNLLYFEVYAGSDRTSVQTTLPAVVFSANLDNLTNTTELMTIQDEKNVAHVFTSTISLEVFATGVDTSTAIGFKRKVLLVDATDYTPVGDTDIDNAVLEARGTAALAAYRGLQTFDGEINQNSSYKYGTDYYIGDMVEMRTATGFGNYLRVTEQILSSDSTGEAAYPTLTKILTVTPGSWASWNSTIEWADLEDPSEYNIMWAEAP